MPNGTLWIAKAPPGNPGGRVGTFYDRRQEKGRCIVRTANQFWRANHLTGNGRGRHSVEVFTIISNELNRDLGQ